jgi:hypothetical protein
MKAGDEHGGPGGQVLRPEEEVGAESRERRESVGHHEGAYAVHAVLQVQVDEEGLEAREANSTRWWLRGFTK